jgi:hypothetical protein
MIEEITVIATDRRRLIDYRWDEGVHRIRQAHLKHVVESDVSDKYGNVAGHSGLRCPSLAEVEGDPDV